MLRIYHGNRLDTLRDVLVEMIHQHPLQDPFAQETILVQSPGMAQWLQLELAERTGIAASLTFPLPASFLWQVFVNALPDIPERSAYAKPVLTWQLMRRLPTVLDTPEFAILRGYLQQDDNPGRLYHLAARIADLYDQYLVYRPEWIADWEQGGNLCADEAEFAWQPRLWRTLVEDMQAHGQPHWHRANMHTALIAALKAGQGVSDLPERVFVFGISALPQSYLEMLVALGQHTDIHLMVANPCRHYWGDIVDPGFIAKLNRLWISRGIETAQHYLHSGHPILASMGKLGRDYLYQIQTLGQPEADIFSEPCYGTLLEALQSDILELENRTQGEPLHFTAPDHSVQIHSTTSALREVQVLHDQLLAMFEAHPDLQPRDVIVMMPDVVQYAPFIDAVFGNAPADCYLPYAISDRSADQEVPLLASFLQLLQLQHSRLSVTQVSSLLELPATLRRFGLDEEEFATLRHWVRECGIHWGLNQQGREQAGFPGFAQNSWASGLDRMFAGYALGNTGQLWQGVAPFGEVRGLSATALGKLAAFIDRLTHWSDWFQGERPLAEWSTSISQLIEDFYQPDEPESDAIGLIRTALESLQQTQETAAFAQPFPAQVLLDYLQEQLSTQRASQRFLSGQINFCTLMPMRAIPFRIVCLLGMNDGDYPRTIAPAGFDLMQRHPKRGDRSRRDDDRYLLLEAVLAARDCLYISYQGRSQADNRALQPSVLISEILEYCDLAYQIDGAKPSEQQRTDHPLNAYSDAYYQPHSGVFSYNPNWLLTPPARDENNAHVLPEQAATALELADLISFIGQPVDYFFKQRLRVFFADQAVVLDDDEPFAVEGLEKYKVRDQLLKQRLAGEDPSVSADFIRQTGVFPVGLAGDQTLNTYVQDVGDLYEKLLGLMQGEKHAHEVRLMVDGCPLQGWIEHCYESHILNYSVSALKGKHYFSIWVQHLVSCASGLARPTTYRALSGEFTYKPVPQADALQYLTPIVALWRAGLNYPVNWLPEPAFAWLTKQEQPEKAQAEALKAFEKSLETNPYVQRMQYRWEDWSEPMVTITERCFAPLMDYLEQP